LPKTPKDKLLPEFENVVSYTDLLQEAYRFIFNFCPGNVDNQELMFSYLPYFVTHHTQMPELMTAAAATACIQDNLSLCNMVRVDLVRAIFEGLLHNQRLRETECLWLTFLGELIEPAHHLSRRNQNLIIKCLLEYGEGVLLLYRTVAEQVDRTRLLAVCENAIPISDKTIAYHLACLKLLVRCCSKQNQDGALYVRTLFRLSDLVCSALQLRQVGSEDIRRSSHASSRERRMSRFSLKKTVAGSMPDAVARALKTPLLQLLLEAFVLFEGDGASDQLSSADSWIWTTNLQNFMMVSQLGDISLFQMLLNEMTDFVGRCQGGGGGGGEVHAGGEFSTYIYDAVLPFMAGYAKLYVTDTMRFSPVYQGILESMRSLLHLLQLHSTCRSHSDIILTVASELHIRLDEMDRDPMHRGDTLTPDASGLLETSSAGHYLQKWRSFCDDFAMMVGTRDAKRFLGVGTQNLALLLGQNDQLKGARFTYPTLLKGLIKSLTESSDSFPHETTLTVLHQLRLMMHLEDDPAVEPMHVANFERFLNNSPVLKQEPHLPSLRWVQCKFDQIGAMQLALHLVGHTNMLVQLAAVRLANVLVQDANRVVQGSVHESFKSSADESFFLAAKTILNAVSEQGRRHRQSDSMPGIHMRSQQAVGDRGAVTESELPITLAKELSDLLGALCSKQCTAMQLLLQRQPNHVNNYDLLAEAVKVLQHVQVGHAARAPFFWATMGSVRSRTRASFAANGQWVCDRWSSQMD
jgi:hypothetical protein